MKRLFCLFWHFTTVGKIAKPYHIETFDVFSTSCKNFVNFCAVNHWHVVARLQKVDRCTHAKIRIVSTIAYRLIFAKLWANVERLVGLITVYSNCDDPLKGRCYGNRFVARVAENWHRPTGTLSSILWAGIRWLLGAAPAPRGGLGRLSLPVHYSSLPRFWSVQQKSDRFCRCIRFRSAWILQA